MKEAQKFPFDVLLDDIRSALNVGAIFRTCDGAGVRKLYLGGITAYPPHNRIPKTALGAEEFVEWERVADSVEFVTDLKAKGHFIVAVEQTPRSQPFNEVNYPKNSLLVFGNEITGVNPKILELADVHLEVPMFGQKESLNVATTAGILAYHVALGLNDQLKTVN
jgi:tRNA G18 (ribose-2'-O)-methylase SpoU